MPDQLQLRGGTTTEHNSFTGALREVTVDTTKKTLVVHDGASAGGTALMKESGGNAASSVGIGTGGTNAINIDSNQKVGIGTGSQTAKLHVVETTSTTAVKIKSGTSTNQNTHVTLFNDSDVPLNLGIFGSAAGAAGAIAANTAFISSNSSTGLAIAANHESGIIKFGTGSSTTTRMNIDSSGRVGIGTTTQGNTEDGAGLKVDTYVQRSTIYHSPDGYYAASLGKVTNGKTKVWAAVDSSYAQANAVSAGIFLKAFFQDAGGSGCGSTIKNLKSDNSLVFSTVTTGSNGAPAVESERLRITTSGDVLIGTSSTSNGASGGKFFEDGKLLQIIRNDSSTHLFLNKTTGNDGTVATFAIASATKGSISVTSSATAFNTSNSDRSLKKNFESWNEDVLNLFKNINPQKFNFINQNDGDDKTKGFVAQDMVGSFPEAYTKGVEDDAKYMFNPSGMVVYLMKAIQELQAKVEALEAA